MKYPVSQHEREAADNVFSYHPAKDDQAKRYEENRNACGAAWAVFIENCPPSAERTLAMRKLQEAMMYANAAIAINESNPPASKPEGEGRP